MFVLWEKIFFYSDFNAFFSFFSFTIIWQNVVSCCVKVVLKSREKRINNFCISTIPLFIRERIPAKRSFFKKKKKKNSRSNDESKGKKKNARIRKTRIEVNIYRKKKKYKIEPTSSNDNVKRYKKKWNNEIVSRLESFRPQKYFVTRELRNATSYYRYVMIYRFKLIFHAREMEINSSSISYEALIIIQGHKTQPHETLCRLIN